MKNPASRRLSLLALLSFSFAAEARVVSPSATEVRFELESEFVTGETGPAARVLVLTQSKHLFGYLQNDDLPGKFGLNSNVPGLGAPRWEPEVEVLGDRLLGEGRREVKYRMRGTLLLHRQVATQLLPRKEWEVQLPYEIDSFYDVNCTDKDHKAKEEFWYFHNPFRAGCEHLRREPLAKTSPLQLSPMNPAPEDEAVGLAALHADNGNGELFEITAINGFDESSTNPRDDGRANFRAMNEWFRSEGYEETVLAKFKNRPVHQFDKIVRRPGQPDLHVRITRLLAETDLDGGKHRTFAKFLKRAIESSDVVIYEGHSGLGANLDLATIERRLLHSRDKKLGRTIEFDRRKKQLFFFDSCSSYSYFLGMFAGRKDPGTLAVMTNGLASLFGYELPMTKHFYRHLTDARNVGLTWLGLLGDMEKPLRGNTFLLNVDLN